MKLIFAFTAILAVALAAPPAKEDSVVLVKETLHNNIGIGGYSFNYEQSDGVTRDETAELENAGTEDEALVVRGSYSWVDEPTGQRFTITYTADKSGFHPVGDHIPA